MAVIVECSTVIARNAAIEARYPGGLEKYEQDCPNATFCTDGTICRVSFMASNDALSFVRELKELGLEGPADLAMVHPDSGLVEPSDWLELDLRCFPRPDGSEFGATIAWLRGREPTSFVAPAGWSPGELFRLPTEELERDYEVVENRDGVLAYRHRETGQTIYVGRPERYVEQEEAAKQQADRFNRLYGEGVALAENHLILEERELRRPGWLARRRLKRALKLLLEALTLDSSAMQPMFFVAKIHQRLDHHDEAFEWMLRANRAAPGNVSVAKEFGLLAAELGRHEEAIPAMEVAVQSEHPDGGLLHNLGLSYLMARRPQDARTALLRAAAQEPEDQLTRSLLRLATDVVEGAKPCPTSIEEVRRAVRMH